MILDNFIQLIVLRENDLQIGWLVLAVLVIALDCIWVHWHGFSLPWLLPYISPSETMKLSNHQEALKSVPVRFLKLCQKYFASLAAESYLHRDNQGQW